MEQIRGRKGKMADKMKDIKRKRRGSTGTMEECLKKKRERERRGRK